MCRIAGIFDPLNIINLQSDMLKMCDVMHRGGPDDLNIPRLNPLAFFGLKDDIKLLQMLQIEHFILMLILRYILAILVKQFFFGTKQN